MKLKHTGMLLLLVLTVTAPPVLAQNETTTTTPDTPTAEAGDDLRLDNVTTITDWRVDNGTLVLALNSSGGNTVTLTETVDNGGGAAAVAVKSVTVPRGQSTVTVDLLGGATSTVLVTSRLSIDEGRGIEIDPDNGGGPLIGGPWTWTDSALVGAVVGLGIAATVLYRAVLDRVGDRGSEVLAG